MNKNYLVIQDMGYDGIIPIGIFSSPETAIKYCKENPTRLDSLEVREYELDKPMTFEYNIIYSEKAKKVCQIDNVSESIPSLDEVRSILSKVPMSKFTEK